MHNSPPWPREQEGAEQKEEQSGGWPSWEGGGWLLEEEKDQLIRGEEEEGLLIGGEEDQLLGEDEGWDEDQPLRDEKDQLLGGLDKTWNMSFFKAFLYTWDTCACHAWWGFIWYIHCWFTFFKKTSNY